MKANETNQIIKKVDDLLEKIDTLMWMIRNHHVGIDTNKYRKGSKHVSNIITS